MDIVARKIKINNTKSPELVSPGLLVI